MLNTLKTRLLTIISIAVLCLSILIANFAFQHDTPPPSDSLLPVTTAYTAQQTTTTSAQPVFAKISANISAQHAYCIDLTDGQVLYEKNADETTSPASTTKLLTALTVLDYCDPAEIVTIGDEIDCIAPDSSRAWIQKGNQMSVYDLLAAMLIPSGNDAAYTLASYTGQKLGEEEPVEGFVARMNQKAVAVGAFSSWFKTPDGYDADGQYTTAKDISYISRYCLENHIISEIVKQPSMTLSYTNGEEFTVQNSNKLLDPDNIYYCPQAIGIKTGWTDQALGCLSCAAVFDGHTVLCVIMKSGWDERYEDALTLFSEMHAQ